MTNQDRSTISFAKLERSKSMPHFLDVQRQAFERLLQMEENEEDRRDRGLERVFNEIFPITDVHENFALEFVSYSLGEPKYSVEECMERDMTFAAPLKARLRLVVYETLGEDGKGEKRPRDILEKEVYLGDLPLLTEQGTFVVNGAERVIVSQLHRSPGVVFEESIHPNGTRLFSSRIIPFRGSWVEFTLDIHDVIHVHIDKKKKFPATALLRAFGYGSDTDILNLFYTTRTVDVEVATDDRGARREVTGTLLARTLLDDEFEGEPVALELNSFGEDTPACWLAEPVTPDGAEASIAVAGDVIDAPLVATLLEAGCETVSVLEDEEAFVARHGTELTDDVLSRLQRAGVTTVEVYSSATFISLRGSYGDLEMRRDWSQRPQLDADGGREGGSVRCGSVRQAQGSEGQGSARVHRRTARRVPADPQHARQGPDEQRGRRALLDILAGPTRRGAQRGDRAHGPGPAVLQPEAL